MPLAATSPVWETSFAAGLMVTCTFSNFGFLYLADLREARRRGTPENREKHVHTHMLVHTRTHAEPGPRDGLRSRPGTRGRETPLGPRGQRLSASQAGWASASWRAEPAAAPLGAHRRSAAEACGAAASCGPSPRAADVSSCLKLTRPVGKFYDSLWFPGKT